MSTTTTTTTTTSSAEQKPQEEQQQQQQQQNSSSENGKQKSPGTSQQPSGQQTPRSSKNKTPPAAVGNTNKTPSVTSAKEEKEETEEEKQARLKKEAEEELLLRPWMSPAKPSILKHHHDEMKKEKNVEKEDEKEKKTEQEGSEQQKTGSDGEKEKEKKREVPPASAPAAAASTKKSEEQGEDHHIAFKEQPEVFPDHIYSQQARLLKKLKEQKENDEQSPSRQIQEDLMEVDDVCERLYAEAIAKRRLAEEASKQRQRELEDEEAGFDEECTFHPDISEAAKNSAQLENWEQFLHYREEKNKTAALRWKQKKAKIEKEKRSKEIGEELKMAPLSEKLLAYKKKKGQPHRGPIKDYDKYLGKFILKKTEQDKGLAALESGDNSVREIPDPVAQKELTNRLYEDAIARVAARQVIERARHAADRAKLFQPMTNERLIAKLKELNPDADNDSWLDDANVETRLLSQGESYRLRNERRKNQHELESMKDCTFTPRTNPKSRQMLQNWARHAELGGAGGDPSSINQSVMMRVDRNLDQDGDYAPLQGNGGKVYASEAEALAAVNNSNDGVGTSLQSNQGSEGRSSRGSVGRPRHIPDPDGYFEKVKMRQAERERQLTEKRRQQELAKEDGCTFRPAMAPLTVALAKIRDDKEFGATASTSQSRARAADRDREILMPPHLRPKTAEWGEAKGSPRKYPRGAIMQQQQQQNVYYQQQQLQHPSTARQQHQQQQQDPSYHSNPSTNRSSRLTPRTAKSTGASAAAASRFHSDPYANNNNSNNTSATSQRMQQQQQQQPEPSSSEHFLEDLEHELQGVISNWQSTDGM